jgi:lipid II:glycine glycyltransferase (peptidoglycan interpeptide bridge formation enzyme)
MRDYQDIVQKNDGYGFFHTLIWENIVRDVYKVKPKPLFSLNGSDYAFLTNFEVNNFRSGHKYTNMPFNYYPKPLYNNNNQLTKLISSLESTAKSTGAFVELKMANRLPMDIVKRTNLQEVSSNYNSTLKLPSTYKGYSGQISRNLKSNLKKRYNRFYKEGFQFKKISNLEELNRFYALLAKAYRNRHRMICQPKSLFQSLFQMKDNRFSFEIRTIRNTNDQICSAISVIFDKKGIAYYPWGITDQKYYKFALSYILINELIKDCIQEGFRIIDFGSTPETDKNLLMFKSHWGCENHTTYNYYLHKIPKSVDLNSSYGLLRNLFSITPMFVINLLNPLIVPHFV